MPPACPRCQSAHVVRNGPTGTGEPSFRCRGCGRRFVEAPKKEPVTGERLALVERLLGERLGLRAIARAALVSRSWLQQYVNARYRDETKWEPGPLKKSRAT